VSDHQPRPTGAGVHTTGSIQSAPVLTPRRPRLPRFWLALTLGTLTAGVVGAYWWERQLPARIAAAAAAGRVDQCLRFSDQLSALSWLPGRVPLEQGRCRREKAQQLWRRGRWSEALRLQRQLLNSAAAGRGDQLRLEAWQGELQRTALERFGRGDLPGALRSLEPLGEERSADGNALGDQLRLNWQRNRLELERANRLVKQARWWEALDSLHRLDHPWWQRQAAPLRRRVDAQLSRLSRADQEHDGHGTVPHSVPSGDLDARVQRRIAAGLSEWQAFEEACRELGGKVVEAGPDSACQR